MSTDIEKLVRDAVSKIVATDAAAAMSKIREKKKIIWRHDRFYRQFSDNRSREHSFCFCRLNAEC